MEFGELAAQYEQRLATLFAKPQLSGSFSAPWTQSGVKAPGGRAQFVKSARIMFNAFGAFVPQSEGVDAIVSSLMEKAACHASEAFSKGKALLTHESAQSGRAASPVRPQSDTEFWTMALHKKEAVYLAYMLLVLLRSTLEQLSSCWYLGLLARRHTVSGPVAHFCCE